MKKDQKLNVIQETGIIAIMRAKSSDQLIIAADAIKAGGVKVIEVTMTTPGALDIINQAKAKYGADILFGAGSVLDSETGRAAILSGADFIVAPTLNLELIALCNRYSIPIIPGCYTPSEMQTAWEAGAAYVFIRSVAIWSQQAYVKASNTQLGDIWSNPYGGDQFGTVSLSADSNTLAVGAKYEDSAATGIDGDQSDNTAGSAGAVYLY